MLKVYVIIGAVGLVMCLKIPAQSPTIGLNEASAHGPLQGLVR